MVQKISHRKVSWLKSLLKSNTNLDRKIEKLAVLLKRLCHRLFLEDRYASRCERRAARKMESVRDAHHSKVQMMLMPLNQFT